MHPMLNLVKMASLMPNARFSGELLLHTRFDGVALNSSCNCDTFVRILYECFSNAQRIYLRIKICL